MDYEYPSDVPENWKTPVEKLCDRLNHRLKTEYWGDIVDAMPNCKVIGKDQVYTNVILFYLIDGEKVAYDRPSDWVYPVASMQGIPAHIYNRFEQQRLSATPTVE